MFFQFVGQHGHSSLLRADKGRRVYSQPMGLVHRLALEDGGDEGGSEGVARAYGVGHLHAGRLYKRYAAGRKDVAAIDAARQDKHPQVVLAQQYPAFVLQVDAWIAKHTADGDQLFIVYFQDVAAAHGVAQYLLGIEILTQVDVKYLQRIRRIGHGVQEAADSLTGHDAALRQRAEAHGTRLLGQLLQGIGIGNVVPRHAFLDVIAGYAHIV